jgi:hypothetical protein
MNNEQLAAYQILATIHDGLIKIDIALNNKTVTLDNARKHIKQLMLLTDGVEKQLDSKALTAELKNIGKELIERTKIQYFPNKDNGR